MNERFSSKCRCNGGCYIKVDKYISSSWGLMCTYMKHYLSYRIYLNSTILYMNIALIEDEQP